MTTYVTTKFYFAKISAAAFFDPLAKICAPKLTGHTVSGEMRIMRENNN